MFHKCIMRTLMFHAQIPKSFWADALATTTYLLNRCPTKAIGSLIPYTHLHGRSPPYDTLRVFGCLCYPNIASTAVHKLCPCYVPCVFLLSPHFGQMRRWAAIKMGLEDIHATYYWIGLARGFGLNCPCICILW
jgi:hypothetical protein